MPGSYRIRIAGLIRDLPKVAVSESLEIASFVMLGDTELVEEVARAIYQKAEYPRFAIDVLVCPEAKAIPLAHALAKLTQVNYVVVRKSVKSYMHEPLIEPVQSITTNEPQQLVLDSVDAATLRGRNVCIIDDVVSTGGSIASLQNLLERVGCRVVAKAAALLEEGGYEGTDLVYLERLPVFPLAQTG